MIYYDQLPDEYNPQSKEFTLPEPGRYRAIIESVDMKTPKLEPGKPQRPDYLNLQYGLYDLTTGESKGRLYDLQSESEADLPKYKLKRFIRALGLKLTGPFELKDLCKVILGKQLALDVKHETKEGYAPKAVVDIFAGEIYYPITPVNTPAPTQAPAAPKPIAADVPFTPDIINAPDAHDAEDSDY